VARPDERTMTYHWPGQPPWTHQLDEPRSDQVVVTEHFVTLTTAPGHGG